MPNISIDYTSNLSQAVKASGLVEALHQAAVETGEFPLWGIRTLARPVDSYRVFDGNAHNGFIQIIVRLAPGRDLDKRSRIAKSLFEAAMAALEPVYASQRLGCQLEVQEFTTEVTLSKYNLVD